MKSSLLCQHPKIVINIGVVSRSLFLSMTRVVTKINAKFIVVCQSMLHFGNFLRRLLLYVCLYTWARSFCLKISLFNTPFNINILFQQPKSWVWITHDLALSQCLLKFLSAETKELSMKLNAPKLSKIMTLLKKSLIA